MYFQRQTTFCIHETTFCIHETTFCIHETTFCTSIVVTVFITQCDHNDINKLKKYEKNVFKKLVKK